MGIHELFYPRGVVVVGSAAEGQTGYELIKQILGGGYPQVFAVNPKAQGALGIPGYQTVCQIDQPVDLAIIASPAATVSSVLEDCGQAGIKSIVIISAGVINTHHKLFASLETRPPRGEVVFISQSGALGGAVLSWAEEQGLGFGKLVSYGNRLDLGEIDLLPYLAQGEIGYPAVMKVVSPDIIHKSERGGVRLNIGDDEAARQSFQCIQEVFDGVDFRGVIIYPMIRSSQEVLLGISNDPQFGPVILFGMEGIYTEVLGDISLCVAPIDCDQAEEMIREIQASPILEGARGQPSCDLDALADTLVKFSWLPFQYPQVDEMDLNPVFLFPKGLVVGDVRVILKESKA